MIGTQPGKLGPGTPVDRFCPPTLDQALTLVDQHPNVILAMYNVDFAQLQVKIAEGALQPTLSLQGSAQQAWNPAIGVSQTSLLQGVGQLSLPIYQGGAEYSAIRQTKRRAWTAAHSNLSLLGGRYEKPSCRLGAKLVAQ